MELKKYPRTPHLSGSKLQVGDEDLSQISFSELDGKHLVVEEKCDGANSAISFDETGALYLQSRGHYLTGGYRERHYNLLKQWANVHREAFYRVLGNFNLQDKTISGGCMQSIVYIMMHCRIIFWSLISGTERRSAF